MKFLSFIIIIFLFSCASTIDTQQVVGSWEKKCLSGDGRDNTLEVYQFTPNELISSVTVYDSVDCKGEEYFASQSSKYTLGKQIKTADGNLVIQIDITDPYVGTRKGILKIEEGTLSINFSKDPNIRPKSLGQKKFIKI